MSPAVYVAGALPPEHPFAPLEHKAMPQGGLDSSVVSFV